MDPTKNYGFVVFLTEGWIPIITNLLNSVIAFSKYPIEVGCINFDHDFGNSRIKSKRIDMPNPDFFNITKCKLIACIQTRFDIALLLDGDMIATCDIDKIFEDNEERIQRYTIPLFAKHPHNPFERYDHIIRSLTTKKPKMKWVYSNYLFTKEQTWFLQKALDIMNKVPECGHDFYYPVPEESVLNALLAEHEVDYDLGYNYFPNGFKTVVDSYLGINPAEGKKHIYECYTQYACPVVFYAFHGFDIKNVEYTKGIVETLIRRTRTQESISKVIPKKIYQAWHDKKIKPAFQNYIDKMLRMNPDYEYELFGEEDMDAFILENYDDYVYSSYKKIKLITARVDFWRYLILYKRGGVYLDVDSTFRRPLKELIREGDNAVLTREPNIPYGEYVQWALIFCPGHPILKQVIENVLYNINTNRFPNNVGRMTGPLPFTDAVDLFNVSAENVVTRLDNSKWDFERKPKTTPDCLTTNFGYNYRIYGIEFGDFAIAWVPEKNELYSSENPHWTVGNGSGVLY